MNIKKYKQYVLNYKCSVEYNRFNIENTPPWIKAIAPSTKEYLNHSVKITTAIKKLLKTFLKNVIITRANTTWPTVMLATSRTANVIGRRNCLKSSTIDKIGDKTKVTPFGIKLLKKFL